MGLLNPQVPKPGFDTLFNLAVDRHEAGNIKEALAVFQSLSLIDPRDMGVWEAIARCHEDLGQPYIAALVLSLAEQSREAAS